MKKLVTLLLLLVCSITFAQDLNVEIDADYYISKTNTFVAKKDGGYTTHYLWVEFDKQQNRFIARFSDSKPETLDYILKQHQVTQEDLIPFKSLRKSKTENIITALEKLEFTYPTQGDVKKSYYYTVNFADNYAIQQLYLRDAMQPQVTAPQVIFFTMVPVTVNSEITLLYFFHNNYIQGYVVPIKDEKYYLRLMSNNTAPVQGIAKSEFKRAVQMYYPEGELFTMKNKYGLRQKNSGKVFIPAEYDSIKTIYGGLIVAYHAATPKLFHRNGDGVALPGLRAGHLDPQRRLSALVGNTTHFIDNEGNMVNEIKPMYMDGCGTVPRITESIIKKDGYYVFHHLYEYGNRYEKEYRIAPVSKYANLTFLDGTAKRFYMSHGGPEYKFPQYCFIAQTAEGKSIVQIDYTQVKPVEKVMLPFGDYTFTFNDFSYPVKFSKNGLSGFFPQNEAVRYADLKDFEKGFARFTLPGGKSGWLSFDGGEYPDE